MNDVFNDLYQQLIIDHNQNPKNFKIIEGATHKADGFNPLCGDKIIITLIKNGNNIKDIAFFGEGCAISKASASIMTDIIKGYSIEDTKELFKNFHDAVTKGNNHNNLGKLSVLSGVFKYPSRVKCATLAWHTLMGALQNTSDTIKTE